MLYKESQKNSRFGHFWTLKMSKTGFYKESFGIKVFIPPILEFVIEFRQNSAQTTFKNALLEIQRGVGSPPNGPNGFGHFLQLPDCVTVLPRNK